MARTLRPVPEPIDSWAQLSRTVDALLDKVDRSASAADLELDDLEVAVPDGDGSTTWTLRGRLRLSSPGSPGRDGALA